MALDHEGCLGPSCKCHDLIVKPKKGTKQLRNNSKAQERNLSKLYLAAGFPDARRVPGSGSLAILPGDIDPGEWFLGEAKMTRTGKMTIQPLWIKKIREQAKQMGRPWYMLHTWTASGDDQFTKLATLSEDTFFELLRRLRAAEGQLNDTNQ